MAPLSPDEQVNDLLTLIIIIYPSVAALTPTTNCPDVAVIASQYQ